MEELSGCWLEAIRADTVAIELLKIRTHLTSTSTPLLSTSSPSSPYPSTFTRSSSPSIKDPEIITAILRHVEQTSRLLRDLYDLFPIYRIRVPVIVYYLTVILPCLQKTLRDMLAFLTCEDFSLSLRWLRMYERLNEQGGMTLTLRFVMYVDFLVQCVRLLTGSPTYDPTTLELLRIRVLRLRSLRGIPAPPIPVQPHLAPTQPNLVDLERRHWAEKIFDDHAQPLSQTCLKHRRDSRCFGPSMNEMRLGISPHSKVLFKLPFDKNRLSIALYLDDTTLDQSPRFLCRWMDKHNNPHYSSYGVHELCIKRRGSALCFKRWSGYREHPTSWMALFFNRRWILPLTFRLRGSIYSYVKIACCGCKWGVEEMSLTDLQMSSDTWIARHTRHRVWIKDLHLYVFCNEYSRRTQVRKHGEFELYFVHGAAAEAFIEIFYPLDSESGSEEGSGSLVDQ
ncbi:predicted protein [Sclerotinia sclerotiorum 1980 UF-70]|uniref:Uncharacterized protein n=1 Tax=Sclerotinia sclerotiorum (strain ATCC 18683 / 1980 / Ss-1) TaxID=665079 RepID=A7E7A6_SCLS1|nr:predicted protein [Sclerotinia sclerotiorum 1980 UF-70]EDN96258.1 predicted protein [Sclerotinia sclerotiorum 1980 UF-70]